MTVSDMAPGEIREYNGVMVRQVRNGALQRVDNGRMMTPPDAEHRLEPVRTSEQAQRLNFARWHGAAQDAYKRKVQDALAGRGDNTLLDTIEQARGEALGVLAEEVVFNPDVRGIDRIKAHEHILEQAGMDARPPKSAALTGDTGTTSLEQAISDGMLDALERYRSRNG